MRLDERETTIDFTDDRGIATVMTYNPTPRNKLLKLFDEREEVVIVWVDDEGIEVKFPKKWIRIQPPPKLSDEQREAMKNRMLQARSSMARDGRN